MRVAFKTTGCKVNQFDSETVMATLADLPVVICGPDDGADIVVVNACTVTANADRDGRAAAYRAARTGARVVLGGCMATRIEEQGASGELPPEIIIAGGTADRTRLLSTLRAMIIDTAGQLSSVVPAEAAPPAGPDSVVADVSGEDPPDADVAVAVRARPLIKIQDGCDCRCSYCIVPLVRGPSRSVAIENVTAQVLAASAAGAAEVVLTGVDLAAWGRIDDGRYGHLADLLRHLTSLGTGMRFRLSSLEPHGLDDELVETIACGSDICPHLHIPMQSGADGVLARMNRPYSAAVFAALVGKAARAIPGLVVGMDVIVGFPGESDTEFAETRALVESLPTTYLHVFPFSPRPGTPAATAADQVPDAVRRERGRILRVIGAGRRAAHAASLVGRDIETVDIRPAPGGMLALAADYTRVLVTGRFDMADGRRMITVTGVDGAAVIGEDRT